LKNDPNCLVEITDADTADGPDSNAISIAGFTFRQFMQNFIEQAKDVFGEKVWVDRVLPVDGFYVGKPVVITDCRFIIEADRIKKLGGFLVKIDRPFSTNDVHVSEIEQLKITPDYVVHNNGTIDSLYHELETMLDSLLELVG